MERGAGDLGARLAATGQEHRWQHQHQHQSKLCQQLNYVIWLTGRAQMQMLWVSPERQLEKEKARVREG